MKTETSPLYHFIATVFCVIVILSNIVSAKMIQLPVFHDFSIPAGLIAYPLAFFLSDLVTEVFGPRKAKQMVYLAFGMNILSYLMIQLILFLPSTSAAQTEAFALVFGLNGKLVFGSLLAYAVGQMIDIKLYTVIQKWTGPSLLWVRNNGSTCIAQLFDTSIVNLIHLYWGLKMPLETVLPIMLFSYVYKCTFSLGMTPLYYFLVGLSRQFLRWNTSVADKKIMNR